MLEVILGMEFGFSGVAWMAVAIYAAGTLALVRSHRATTTTA
jgi:hypothetical protein